MPNTNYSIPLYPPTSNAYRSKPLQNQLNSYQPQADQVCFQGNHRTIYCYSDPFTRKMMPTTTEPVKLTDKQQTEIFNQGWSRLKTAKTLKEKQEALNAIIYSVERNKDSHCVGISRTIAERLSSGTPVQLASFQHLNHQFKSDGTHGLLYARKGVPLDLPGNYYHGRPEDEVRTMVFSSQRHPAKDVLHKNLLDAYDINEDGLKNAHNAQDVTSALKQAGNGAIGYVFPGLHVFPVVNVKGDIIALPNFAESPSCAEPLTDKLCDNLQLSYAISNQKVFGLSSEKPAAKETSSEEDAEIHEAYQEAAKKSTSSKTTDPIQLDTLPGKQASVSVESTRKTQSAKGNSLITWIQSQWTSLTKWFKNLCSSNK